MKGLCRASVGLVGLLAMSCSASVGTVNLPEPAVTSTAAPAVISPGPERSTSDSITVLLIGDSVTYELAPAISDALESSGQVEVVELTQFGFALSLNTLNNWRTTWPGVIRNVDPDVVVMQTGTWDVEDNLQAAGRVPAPEDPDWEAAFRTVLDEATFVLTISGAEILWMSMLPGPDPEPARVMNEQVEKLADRSQLVSMVDVAAPLRDDDGGFLEVDDAENHLRKPDGVHLCVTGAEKAAEVLVEVFEQRYGVVVDKTWQDGPWRADGRYDLDPCADRL